MDSVFVQSIKLYQVFFFIFFVFPPAAAFFLLCKDISIINEHDLGQGNLINYYTIFLIVPNPGESTPTT